MFASIFGLFKTFGPFNLAYRLIFGFPLVIVAIQVPLLIYYFQNDSPQYYDDNKMVFNQMKTYELIYINLDKVIHKNRHRGINSNSSSTSYSQTLKKYESKSVSISMFFRSPLRKSLIIGSTLALFQQMTGINAVIFYSSEIFDKHNKGENEYYGRIGTLLVGVVNCISSALGIYMLYKFKRKPLLYNGMIGMAISLSLLSYLHDDKV